MRINECYVVLDIKHLQHKHITEHQLRSAYHKCALQCHPDRHPNNKNANQEFQKLSTAYNTLCTHIKNKPDDTDNIYTNLNTNTTKTFKPQDWEWAFEKLTDQARVFWNECSESHLIKQLWKQYISLNSQNTSPCKSSKYYHDNQIPTKTHVLPPSRDIVLSFEISDNDVTQAVQHKLTYFQHTYERQSTEPIVWHKISSVKKELLVSCLHEHTVFYKQGHLVNDVYGNVEVFLYVK